MRWFLATSALFATLTFAQGHGPAEWIQEGRFRNAAGDLCCGERDCRELADTDVGVTASGYWSKA